MEDGFRRAQIHVGVDAETEEIREAKDIVNRLIDSAHLNVEGRQEDKDRLFKLLNRMEVWWW